MKIDKKLAGRIIAEIKSRKIDFSKKDYSFFDLVAGAKVETEHNDTVGGSVAKFIDIAIDHLDEFGNYYKGLKKMEKNLEKKAINLSSLVSGIGSVAGAAKPYLRHYGNLMSTDIGKLKNQRSVYNKAMEWATNPIAKGRSARRATQIAEGINMPEVESTIRNARIAQHGTLGAGLLGGGYVANKLDNMSQPRQQEFNIPGYGPYEYGMEGQAMNRYYEQGIIDKCAEYGVNPAQLIKISGGSVNTSLLSKGVRGISDISKRYWDLLRGHTLATSMDPEIVQGRQFMKNRHDRIIAGKSLRESDKIIDIGLPNKYTNEWLKGVGTRVGTAGAGLGLADVGYHSLRGNEKKAFNMSMLRPAIRQVASGLKGEIPVNNRLFSKLGIYPKSYTTGLWLRNKLTQLTNSDLVNAPINPALLR